MANHLAYAIGTKGHIPFQQFVLWKNLRNRQACLVFYVRLKAATN